MSIKCVLWTNISYERGKTDCVLYRKLELPEPLVAVGAIAGVRLLLGSDGRVFAYTGGHESFFDGVDQEYYIQCSLYYYGTVRGIREIVMLLSEQHGWSRADGCWWPGTMGCRDNCISAGSLTGPHDEG